MTLHEIREVEVEVEDDVGFDVDVDGGRKG